MATNYIIELKRGLKANLPASDTHIGQPYFCTDTNELFIWNGTIMAPVAGTGGSSAFSALLSGTNTSATMTVGTGASLIPSGTGLVNATEINGIPITGVLTHAGQIPISQPGNTSAVWADPFVQGVYAPGANVNTAFSGSPINPVLIGGSDYAGTPLLHDIKVDSSGQIYLGNSSLAVTGTFWQATQPVSIASPVAVTGTFWQTTQPVSGTVAATQSGTWNVTNAGTFAVQSSITTLGQQLAAASVPVVLTAAQLTTLTPPAAITNYANETGGNLATIASRTPALGQALAAASVPVVLTAAQLATLTPLSTVAVTGTFWQATQPVSLASTTITGTVASTQSGTWTVATNADGSASGGTAATKSILVGGVYNSSAPTLTNGQQASLQFNSSGALIVSTTGSGSNAAAGTTGSGVPSSADYVGVNISGNLVGVTGVSLTNAKAMTVAMVDGSGNQITSFGGGTQYATGSAQATPTGTAALGWDGTNVRVLSSDSSGQLKVLVENTVPVSGTFWQTTQPVSGTVAATQSGTWNVTNAGTFAVQASITTLGQQLAAASVPVVLTAAQLTTLTPPAAITNYANETGGNLATIATNTGHIPALGQALAAASVPVVLTAAQITTLTPPTTVAVTQSTSPWVVSNSGTFAVQATLNAETTKVIGTVNVAASQTIAVTQATAANLNATVVGTGTFATQAQLTPVTSGGCSTAVSQALTTTINVKASAGQLYGYTISNPNASVAYVEYYNTTTTPGTIGATTNLLLEVMIPAGATANVSFDNGIAFSSGIAVAVATTATGNTAPGTGLTITTLYK